MGAKKGVLALVVVFVGFWMFTDPNGLAETARTAGSAGWDGTREVFSALIRFLNELF
ncbi:hypothetical protein [Nocardioides sp.]|uniref:hypothetical protein n=1 Tax=Nocardioides sp. TaxID=35761 RepID=UPI0027353508|nr:hypothetical protein [Nocardioides sp.]MDP3893371.1 hypothetical protein [Nocardioides sp.]